MTLRVRIFQQRRAVRFCIRSIIFYRMSRRYVNVNIRTTSSLCCSIINAKEKASEMRDRVTKSESYEDALEIIREYVDIIES